MNFSKKLGSFLAIASAMTFSLSANATTCNDLSGLISSNGISNTFEANVVTAFNETSTLGYQGEGLVTGMWASLMDTQGIVCSVYTVSSAAPDSDTEKGNKAWLGSRVISAQKANTANAFSLDTLSLPTGAITVATYEGGSLYGLQHSNPVDAFTAYDGDPTTYGTGSGDPLVGNKVGGINVFGGGIALYDADGNKVGAVGVSGDTSCRDAAMAFRLRVNLGLDSPQAEFPLALVKGGQLNAIFQQPACGVNDPDDEVYYGTYVIDSIVPKGKDK